MKHGLATLTSAALFLLGCGTEITDGTGGGDAGTGGSDAGTGGSDVGTGGSDVGTGGHAAACSEPPVSQIFEPGAYFLVVDLEAPVPTQLQLMAWFDVDTATGVVTARLTNADRNPGPTCGCSADEACSSVGPAPCVLPSTKAASEDEYSDFLVPNPDPPEGYSFTTSACTFDQPDGTVTFATAPVDVVIAQPPVTIVGTRLTAECVADAEGVLRCEGSIESDQVLLGSAASGPAQGTLVGRTIPDDEVPGDIPKP